MPDSSSPREGLTHLTVSQLVPSPLNPRKRSDPEALAQLAASIRAQGVRQNLVARPHPTDEGCFEIAAGERRWRAVKLLAEDDNAMILAHPAAEFPIPVRVAALTDLELLELATVENMQRDPLHWCDEAEAYAALEAGGIPTAAIAARIGLTQRHVQKRIALARGLDPLLKAAGRKDELTLAQAQAFLAVPPARQKKAYGAIAKEMRRWEMDADDIRRHLEEHLVPVTWALFPLERYTGAFTEDTLPEDAPSGKPRESEDEARYFADPDQFAKLQARAIEEKRAELAETWAFAELIALKQRGHGGLRLPYDGKYVELHGRPDKARAGAVILVSPALEVEIVENVMERKAALAAERAAARGKTAKKQGASKEGAGPPLTAAALAEAKRVKTRALQDAIARAPGAALKLAIIGLLGDHDVVRVATAPLPPGNPAVGPEVLVAEKRFAAALGKFVERRESHEGGYHDSSGLLAIRGRWDRDARNAAELWELLGGMKDAELHALFAALVAERCGSFNGFRAAPGDHPLAIAVAEELKVDLAGKLPLAAEYLAGYRRPRLVALALESKAAAPGDAAALGKLPKGKLVARILESPTRDPAYVPPEMRFGSEKEIAALLAASIPQSTPSSPAAEGGARRARGEGKKPRATRVSAKPITAKAGTKQKGKKR